MELSDTKTLGTLGHFSHLFLACAVHKRGYFDPNQLIRNGGKQIRHKGHNPGLRDVRAVAETQFVLGSHADWRFNAVV